MEYWLVNSVNNCRTKAHGYVRYVDETIAPNGVAVEFDAVVDVILLDR